jgi:hypothetical protein
MKSHCTLTASKIKFFKNLIGLDYQRAKKRIINRPRRAKKNKIKMKKQRGLKRYYRNLETKNDFANWDRFDFDKNSNAWFDFWHWHFDWLGYGDNSFKRRKPHLDKLFRHFESILDKVKNYKNDFQLFIVCHDYKSSLDGIYLHTPNPNTDNFPVQWDNLTNETTLTNKQFENYIKPLDFEILYGKTIAGAFCILYKKGTGNNNFIKSVN